MTYRKTFPRFFLGVCLAFSLTACDSTESNNGDGNGNGETIGQGTVTITGDVQTSIDGGAVFYPYIDSGYGITIADVDFATIEDDEDLPDEYLDIELSLDPTVGTIIIDRGEEVYVEYQHPDGDLYATSGTITITEATNERLIGTVAAEMRPSSDLDMVAGQMTASFEALRLTAE